MMLRFFLQKHFVHYGSERFAAKQQCAAHFAEAERMLDLVAEVAAQRLVLEAARVVQVVAVHLAGQDDAELHHLLHGHWGEGLQGDVIVQLRHKQESHSSACANSVNFVSLAACSPLGPDQWPSPPPPLWLHLLSRIKVSKISSTFDRRPNSLVIRINIHRNGESVNSREPLEQHSGCFSDTRPE